MPIGGTGQAAFNAMKAAEDAASDAYFAANADENGAITQAEQPGLVEVIRVAGLNALFAHIIANGLISHAANPVAPGLTVPGPIPVTGTLTVTGGTIS